MQDSIKNRQQLLRPRLWYFSDELHAVVFPEILVHKWRRRAILAAVLLFALFLDYATGPTIRFPALYAIPILMAAWYEGFWPAVLMGGGIIGVRLVMESYLWNLVPWPIEDSLINSATALFFVAVISWFAAMAGRLTREVQLLGGLLTVCSTCHRFHDDHGQWRKFDEFIMERSQALVSHTLCPTCAKQSE